MSQTRLGVYERSPEAFIDASFVEGLDENGMIEKLYEK